MRKYRTQPQRRPRVAHCRRHEPLYNDRDLQHSLASRCSHFRSLDMSMTLTDLVAPNAIIPALKVNGKKQAIQELAARAAELTGQSERAILEILLQREKLGSTAVGNGVAIPHGKLAKLGRLFGLFARLERPIDFEALDNQPVDLAVSYTHLR